ncbi:hypothetical protein NB689_002479 [Xanthomonas sacchari]|nr:hypothetical protein [Xanthomonas sacchari]
MAIGAAVGDLLVGAAGGEHLPGDAPRVLAQVGAGTAAAGQAQAAVARVHHEQHVLGFQAFGDVLDLGHRNRVGGELRRVRVGGHDVAEVAPGGQLAGRTVAGEEHEHAVVLADAAVCEAIVESGQDVVAGRLLVLQHDHLRRRETEAAGQRLRDGLRIVGRVLQLGPVRVVVDADNDGPRLVIAAGHRRCGGIAGRARHAEVAPVPGGELIAVGAEPVQDLRQRLDRAFVDVVEQQDAALLAADLLEHALHDRLRHRVGPVQRIHVPHHRLQAGLAEDLHALGVARTVGEAEQRGALGVDRAQHAVGVQDLAAQRGAGFLGQLRVGQAVVADGVALLHQAAADAGQRRQVDLAIRLQLAQVAAHFEERGRHVVALEDGDDLVGVFAMRAVVETQHHGLRRQIAAEHLTVAVLHRHRVRGDHAVVAQDRLARVQRAQVGDVVLPLLALLHDRPGAIEAAEDRGDLAVVGAFDLVERFQVFADALVQLDRRQRGVLADAHLPVGENLAECQAVGVVQVRRRFDVVQQAADRGEALRVGQRQQRIKLLGQRLAALQALVEQLLADAAGGLSVGR